jgi:hypothetical protein
MGISTTSCLDNSRSTFLKNLTSAQTDPNPTPSPKPSSKPSPSPSPTPGTQQLFSWNKSNVPSFQLNLGSSKSASVELVAGTYSGSVNLRAEADELAELDPAGFVKISVSPETVNLTPGGKQTITVSVAADTMAPDFNLHLHLVASETTSNPRELPLEIPLQVQPVYEVSIKGGAVPEDWGLGKTINFRRHTNGVTVRFVNMDTAGTHQVHSSGAIPHSDAPMAAAVGTNPGGTYEKVVMPGSPSSATVYCHLHETTTQGHTLNFNVGSNLATYTQVQTKVLNPSCVSCHKAGNALGGIALDTYSATVSTVTPNNAAASLLFTSSKPGTGTMPPGSSLTTEQLLQLYDWIQAGALNN